MALDIDLEVFRKSPVYRAAVEKGLIHDDDWVGDYVKSGDSQPAKRSIHIHLHK